MGFLPLLGMKGRSVLLGILVMLLGSNFKSLVPYKCSAQSPAFAGGLVQSAWFADVAWETGQSNQYTETVLKQQNGAPDAFSRAMSTPGEPPVTFFFFFFLLFASM